jgi:hypothetical protein
MHGWRVRSGCLGGGGEVGRSLGLLLLDGEVGSGAGFAAVACVYLRVGKLWVSSRLVLWLPSCSCFSLWVQ